MFSNAPHRRASWLAAAAVCLGAVTAAAPASAYTCSASALRGAVLTRTGVEPVVADGGCRNQNVSLSTLPAPLSGSAGAVTNLSGPAGRPAEQLAQAWAGLDNVAVGSLRDTPVKRPAPQIPAGLDAVSVPLPGLTLLGLPAQITVDALPAARALIPDRTLPDLPLAAVNSVRSMVSAQCLSGLPNLVGASAVEGLRGLGESLPTDQAVAQTVTLLAERTIALDAIDIDRVVLPAGLSFTSPVNGAALRTAVTRALGGFAPIVLPATVGEVSTTPAEQTGGDGVIEQRALRMTVTMAGQTVADLVMGIARVATDGLSCAEAAVAPVIERPTPVAPASQLAVSCAKASVTLVNVLDKGDHVLLIGAAEKQLIGRRVRIRSTWNGQRVATTRVGPSGYFRATAPVPARSLRYTNRARYLAIAGGHRSMPLKLHRRMRFTALKHSGRRITMTGRVFGPMTHRVIEIRQRISCTRDVVVKRIRPRADGHWRTVVRAPRRSRAVTYRAATMVRNPGSRHMFPTFTLPGYVSL